MACDNDTMLFAYAKSDVTDGCISGCAWTMLVSPKDPKYLGNRSSSGRQPYLWGIISNNYELFFILLFFTRVSTHTCLVSRYYPRQQLLCCLQELHMLARWQTFYNGLLVLWMIINIIMKAWRNIIVEHFPASHKIETSLPMHGSLLFTLVYQSIRYVTRRLMMVSVTQVSNRLAE